MFQANKTGKCGNSHPLIQNTVPSLLSPAPFRDNIYRACDSWKAPTSWKMRGRRPHTTPKSKNSYWTFLGVIIILYFFSQKMNFCHTIAKHSDENQNIWVFVLHLTTHCHSFGSELKPPYLTLFENSPGFVKSVCFCFFNTHVYQWGGLFKQITVHGLMITRQVL